MADLFLQVLQLLSDPGEFAGTITSRLNKAMIFGGFGRGKNSAAAALQLARLQGQFEPYLEWNGLDNDIPPNVVVIAGVFHDPTLFTLEEVATTVQLSVRHFFRIDPLRDNDLYNAQIVYMHSINIDGVHVENQLGIPPDAIPCNLSLETHSDAPNHLCAEILMEYSPEQVRVAVEPLPAQLPLPQAPLPPQNQVAAFDPVALLAVLPAPGLPPPHVAAPPPVPVQPAAPQLTVQPAHAAYPVELIATIAAAVVAAISAAAPQLPPVVPSPPLYLPKQTAIGNQYSANSILIAKLRDPAARALIDPHNLNDRPLCIRGAKAALSARYPMYDPSKPLR